MVETIFSLFSRTIVLIALLSGFLFAVSDTDKISKAQKAYERSEWKEAADLYNSVEKKTRAVWYNLGNAYYQQGRLPDAVACWKRAQSLASQSEKKDITRNIACALKKSGASIASESPYALIMPSPFATQVLFLVVWYSLWIVLLCTVFGYWRRFRFLTITGLMIASGLLGILLMIQYRNGCCAAGIIADKVVHVYAGPHKQYHVLGTVQELDEITVRAKRLGWYKIETKTLRGWIPESTACII